MPETVERELESVGECICEALEALEAERSYQEASAKDNED